MILFAIAAVAFVLLALAWIACPAAIWMVAPARDRRARDQVIGVLRLMLVPVVAISNGLRGRWSVWTPTSQVRADLRPGA